MITRSHPQTQEAASFSVFGQLTPRLKLNKHTLIRKSRLLIAEDELIGARRPYPLPSGNKPLSLGVPRQWRGQGAGAGGDSLLSPLSRTLLPVAVSFVGGGTRVAPPTTPPPPPPHAHTSPPPQKKRMELRRLEREVVVV